MAAILTLAIISAIDLLAAILSKSPLDRSARRIGIYWLAGLAVYLLRTIGTDVRGWVALAAVMSMALGYVLFLRALRRRASGPAAATDRHPPSKPAAFSPAELDRYARHIVLREIGGPGQRRLKDARVLIVGAGDTAGCTLYLLTSDRLHAMTSGAIQFACSDDANVLGKPCDTALWPALLTEGAPIAGPGVNPTLLGTVTRTDLPGLPSVEQVRCRVFV